MRGTQHRRDKGFGLEHQVVEDEAARRGTSKSIPRGEVRGVIGASPIRTQVKRRKARAVGKPARGGEARNTHRCCTRSGDGLVAKSVEANPGSSVGPRVSGSQ